MKITCVDEEVAGLLGRGYYIIPRFQRPFAWDNENVDDFLDDVVARGGEDYFIGSMVVFEEGKTTYAVVDGQQRLTTITLMLCALRDTFAELGDTDSAEGLQGLIEKRDLQAKLKFVLQTPSGYPYFQDVIQRYGDAKGKHEIGPDEKRLTDAFNRIKRYIKHGVDAVLNDKTKDEKTRRAEAIARLEEIRDKALSLKLILIEVDDPDDAYFIFETLNTRGKDLGVSDLVRNLLMSYLKQDNADVDLARDAFERILQLFRSSRADINVNKFLLHQWLSQYSYTSEAKLFRAIRSMIDVDDAQAYLDSLDSDAKLYRAISEPGAPLRKWKKEERSVRDSLGALTLFGVTQPLPMLLALMRAYERKEIKLPALKRAVKAIEDFHFAFTAVASQPSSGGISSMYALHARNLTSAKDPDQRQVEIKSLIDKLRDKRPSRELFIAGFQDLRASEYYSQDKRLVTYILRRFHAVRDGTPVDIDAMSIEHIENQSKAKDHDLVAMVGNILYVDHDLNAELGDQTFEAKKDILENATGVWVDPYVLDGEAWGKEQIEERTYDLAGQAYDELWAF
jgi:Protein of unknown function DUF262/Protein of unknown function (DUF1524)